MGTLFTPPKSIPLLLPSLAWVLGLVLTRLELITLPYFFLPIIVLLIWRKFWLFFLLAGLLFGTASLMWQQHITAIDDSWLNQKIHIQAQVEDIRMTPQYTRLRLTHIQRDDGQSLRAKLDVYVYRQQLDLKVGMQVAATVRLHKPRNKKNPAYFDYVRYMFEQGVAASGSVSDALRVLDSDVSWLDKLRDKVRVSLADIPQAQQGVLLALLLADRSQIPLVIDDAFAASGATHLLAISGLHMGLVAGWGFILAWWLITRREAWIVWFPVRTVALSAGILLMFSYATLAGWPIPAQRAFLMLLAGVLAWVMRAKQVPLNTMFAALVLITLFDPSSVLSISLWLSFSATSALLIWAARQKVSKSMYGQAWMWLKGMFWVSIIASLATLPLIGYVFERLPTWSLLANALLVPLYALWVLPLALVGELLSLLSLPAWAHIVFSWSGMVIDWGNQSLLWIQGLPMGNVWLRSDLPWLFACLGIVLLGVGWLWLQDKRMIASTMLVIILLAYAGMGMSEVSKLPSSLFVWDVGQGASALLVAPEFKLLIDAPGKRGSKFNGGTIAAQNMRHQGMLRLDAVVFTHAQSDHAGGRFRLLANLNDVAEIWLADVPENHVYFKDIISRYPIKWLKKGDVFLAGENTTIQVLWPPQGYSPSNSNNASLVLHITLNTGQTLLLGGDMQAPVERLIWQNLQAVDVMLMPHHGSTTSSTTEFVQKVRPKIVIAQTGYKNRYGFPKEEVVKRYQGVGSEIYNTADGYVLIKLEDLK
ncbi:MAG TPA: DNA internalization-related competence protein ComEC/Rec2 [Mariprofundaceae bacterium]|nr:DNA internalization-related competence protein ComEC/Rec2 [Mariprofundaceae bacterium]